MVQPRLLTQRAVGEDPLLVLVPRLRGIHRDADGPLLSQHRRHLVFVVCDVREAGQDLGETCHVSKAGLAVDALCDPGPVDHARPQLLLEWRHAASSLSCGTRGVGVRRLRQNEVLLPFDEEAEPLVHRAAAAAIAARVDGGQQHRGRAGLLALPFDELDLRARAAAVRLRVPTAVRVVRHEAPAGARAAGADTGDAAAGGAAALGDGGDVLRAAERRVGEHVRALPFQPHAVQRILPPFGVRAVAIVGGIVGVGGAVAGDELLLREGGEGAAARRPCALDAAGRREGPAGPAPPPDRRTPSGSVGQWAS